MENPETRTGFKHANVTEYALQNRSKLLSAALTILRAYCVAERHDAGSQRGAPLKAGVRWFREALVWCGLPDPAATRQELADIADTEAAALRELLNAWHEIDPDNHGLTTAELLDLLRRDSEKYANVRSAVCELSPPTSGPLPGARQLGNRLSHVRRRIIGGKALDYRLRRGHQRAWLLVTSGDAGDSGDSISGREKTESGFGDSGDSVFDRTERQMVTLMTLVIHFPPYAETDNKKFL